MRRLISVTALALLFAATTASAQTVSTDPKQAPAGAYQLETRHTQVLFAIPHFGITNYYGRFDKSSGSLDFNPADPAKSSVSITIDTSSVDMMSPELMKTVQQTGIFDTGDFPEATFKSTSATRTGPNTGTVTGDLTIKNITKPVTFTVTYNGGLKSPLNSAYDIGFHGTTTIKRSDYNMTNMIWSPMVGDEVQIIVEALFTQAKE
jgi:polyisoprenoid-binding protein YceI